MSFSQNQVPKTNVGQFLVRQGYQPGNYHYNPIDYYQGNSNQVPNGNFQQNQVPLTIQQRIANK